MSELIVFIFSTLGTVIGFMWNIVIHPDIGMTLGSFLTACFFFLLVVWIGVMIARRGGGQN